LDFYRLRSAAEIRERGLEESIWDLKSRVFIEWGSLFPEVVEELKKAGRKVLQLKMELIDENPEFRKITQLS
jgi:tRNA A37 threonylcarbamoyladenosine biosynthesis protein TsaE